MASYSYDSTNSDVHKWNYSTSSWQQCPNTYCGATSTTVPPIESDYVLGREGGNNKTVSYWTSRSLYSDGYGTSTSYDYSYRNSYSYNSNHNDVHIWNYLDHDWEECSNAYCTSPAILMAQKTLKPEILSAKAEF
jgi:hypothetical protein